MRALDSFVLSSTGTDSTRINATWSSSTWNIQARGVIENNDDTPNGARITFRVDAHTHRTLIGPWWVLKNRMSMYPRPDSDGGRDVPRSAGECIDSRASSRFEILRVASIIPSNPSSEPIPPPSIEPICSACVSIRSSSTESLFSMTLLPGSEDWPRAGAYTRPLLSSTRADLVRESFSLPGFDEE